MKHTSSFLQPIFLLLILPFVSAGQQNINVKGISTKEVNIHSDGTRLSGNLFYPKEISMDSRLPAILLCHGWGGVKEHLNRTYAPAFAKEGFVVLTFDYRGWGESDSRLVIEGTMPIPNEQGFVTVQAKAIRELVDPYDQLEDIQAALDFLQGEENVDPERMAIWGTSMGGGLVIQTTIDDPRIKVVVSQVGAMHGDWVQEYYPKIHQRAILRARGEMEPIPQNVDKIGELKGTPFLEKIATFRPIEGVQNIKVPTLLIDAENEELFDIREHSEKVYSIIKDRVSSLYIVIPGITHYGIYNEKYTEGLDLAKEWFLKYL